MPVIRLWVKKSTVDKLGLNIILEKKINYFLESVGKCFLFLFLPLFFQPFKHLTSFAKSL